MSQENKPVDEALHASCPLSRRQMLRGTAIAAGGAALAVTALTAPSARAQAAKLSQAVAKYQATPKDGNSCNSCVHFQAPSSCNAVDGTISPAGWCTLYQKKG